MLAGDARRVAQEWVTNVASTSPNVRGAFLHGSINWMPLDAEVPATSDIDIMLVYPDGDTTAKPGKFRYHDLLIEASTIPNGAVSTPEQVLGEYNLAGSFHRPGVLYDPTGYFTRLQQIVAAQYAHENWVQRRCEQARQKALQGFPIDPNAPLPDQVTNWLFATGVGTHIPLVAGLKNPTVRKRYVAVRDLLIDYGAVEDHEFLLELQGSAGLSAAQVSHHLDQLEPLFDLACTVITTPVFYAADITPEARSVPIDGSRELIAAGLHREAIFWIVATWCRCLQVLARDGNPEQLAQFQPAFLALLHDLGIQDANDLTARREQSNAGVERIWERAQLIIAANPTIIG